MRVSHVISPGPMAGAENVVLQGCAALLRQGHSISLLVLTEARCPEHGALFAAAARERGIPVQEISVERRLDIRALGTLRAALKASDAEVVHAHGYKALVYSMLTSPRRTSLAVTHHGETGHDSLARLYEALARTLYRRVDCVFAVSNATSDALIQAGVPRAKLRTVPNPVSFPQPTRRSTDDPPVPLLFVGRLSEEKGLDVLLRALASPDAPAGLTLNVAGDGPCAERWRALGTELGLNGKVRWLGMREDVPELLANAQALVLPSLREGLPLAVLEAASCGVPVLASRVGGVPEAVREGETAVLIAPGDVEGWSRALAALPAQSDALRKAAQRRAPEIRARHAPARWAQLTTQHYCEVAR